MPQNRKEKGGRQNVTASICHCHRRLTPLQRSSSPRLKESRWYWQASLGAGDNNAGFVPLLGLDWHIQLLPRTIKQAQFRHATIWLKLFFPKTCDSNAANAGGYMLHSLIAADQFQLSGKPVACCRLCFGFETCPHTHTHIHTYLHQGRPMNCDMCARSVYREEKGLSRLEENISHINNLPDCCGWIKQ